MGEWEEWCVHTGRCGRNRDERNVFCRRSAPAIRARPARETSTVVVEMKEETLVSRLANSYVDTVYLPPNARGGGANTTASSANYAERPDVQAAAEAYFDDPLALHGDTVPAGTIIKERPIHRLWIYLHAAGASPKDISEQSGAGYKPQYISLVLRQTWARQRLVQILNETGRDRVKHFLSNEVAPSLEVLRDVRDDAQAKKSERISAANSILDRALGKPTVHVETETTSRTLPSDAARLDAEIAAVREQLAQKGVDGLASSRN